LIQPENTLVIEALASATPSIKPTSATLAPSVLTRKTGNRLWIISEEISMNIDTKPMAQTPRGTAFRPRGAGVSSLGDLSSRPRGSDDAAHRRFAHPIEARHLSGRLASS